MTGKQQLELLDNLKDRIEEQEFYIRELTLALSGVTAVSYDSDNVQSSPSDDPMCERIIKLEQEKQKLHDLQKELIDQRVKCVDLIHALNDLTYQKILYIVYIEENSVKTAAKMLGYSYDHARKLHRMALRELDHK